MVATKNSHRNIAARFSVVALIACAGCNPAGSRALVQGDELLREGNVTDAIPKLERATTLMPDEPRAWNLLGVAYHLKGEPRLALQSYRQALTKDRSNLVAIAHYNLGCLLLEQGNSAGAVDELRSYTLITNSAPGFAKLGMAQSRLRQFESAERAFTAARQIDSQNVEALNGLGVIRTLRNQRDAMQYFTSALKVNPKYGPAMLNAAVVAHQSSATKPAALQRYLDYLAAYPASHQVETIKHLVQQLQTDLAPVRPSAATNAPNESTFSRITNVVTFQPSPPVVSTNAALSRMSTFNNTAKPLAVVMRTNPPLVIRTNQVAAASNVPNVPTGLPVTVVAVPSEPIPKIATAQPLVPLAVDSLATNMAPTNTSDDRAATVSPPTLEKEKRGFLTRFNPFRSRPKTEINQTPQSVVLPPPAGGGSFEPVAPAPTKPSFPRYVYRTPQLPGFGDRTAAEKAMQQASIAIKAGKTNEASLSYQKAINSDPSYFDAHYNSALLAFQSGDVARALVGWEMALAIETKSANARYNFALALKQGGFAHDAANELEKIIEENPSDTRAHLSLANLYAQQLNERGKARSHYMKVLELEPRNPQAPAIRFWLAANP
jgi:Tfp pilus assembly protein PilF